VRLFRDSKVSAKLLLIFVSFLTLSCGSDGGDVREFKLSLILGTNSDWYRGAERFAKLVDDRSGGSYRIRIYPHAQLAGNQRTELEMLETGVIDFALESSILLSLIEPAMSIPSLPWLFNSYEDANRVCDGPLGRELLERLPDKGLVGLAFGANGFRQLTNTKTAVRTPADIAGMKIRVPGIRMYIDLFKLLGADPSSMNFAEVFTALAQGTMDGQENPISVIYYARLYEVQKYLSYWNYSYDPIILCANRKLWESLPVPDRDMLMSCAREAMSYERNLVEHGEAALLDSLALKGMKISRLNPQEIASFRNLTAPAYDKLATIVGSDIIEQFREAATKGEGSSK